MQSPPEGLRHWVHQTLVEQKLKGTLPDEIECWHSLVGDAGFRQYYRLDTQPSLLAVLSPPDTEDNPAFISIAEYLRKNGVHVPKVIAHDCQRGYLLVEDLGSSLYLDHLNTETVDTLYGEALLSLLRIQQIEPDSEILPPYSKIKLRDEMSLFTEWFIPQFLGYELNSNEMDTIAKVFTDLESSALEQPQVVVHRDFHSRNLVFVPDGAPGVVDFQEAVIGPVTYDLVSLLRDCYIHWPVENVRRWALAYANMAIDVEVLSSVSEEQFMRWFDWMGLQRHVKVLGIFARLALRDDKPNYLNDLPLVIHYLRSVAGQYTEFNNFLNWFDHQLMPLIQNQHWYRNDYEREPSL